jgi:signal transduction histidine kinase
VDIEQDGDAIEITVRDNGTGFDTAAARNKAAAGGSLGLMSMEERLSLLGGSFELSSEPGAGTRVRGRIPLSPAVLAESPDKGGGGWKKYA